MIKNVCLQSRVGKTKHSSTKQSANILLRPFCIQTRRSWQQYTHLAGEKASVTGRGCTERWQLWEESSQLMEHTGVESRGPKLGWQLGWPWSHWWLTQKEELLNKSRERKDPQIKKVIICFFSLLALFLSLSLFLVLSAKWPLLGLWLCFMTCH